MRIFPPQKVYVSKSLISGLGVFCKDPIFKNEIIEETPIMDLGILKGEKSSFMNNYRFNWPQGNNWEKQVVAWGYGSLYNHSDYPNAHWRSNLEKKTFEFIANRDIEKDEEILIYYGDISYWKDGREHINII